MAAEKKEDGKPGFTVSDRRIFSDPEGQEPVAPPPGQGQPSTSGAPAPGASVPGAAAPTATASPGRDFPAVDFHTFILSLGSSALLHLGELDQPDGAANTPDLALAKHTIDIIAMLQEKTRGNLSPPEERLMESLLYDLRLRYVEKSKTPAGG